MTTSRPLSYDLDSALQAMRPDMRNRVVRMLEREVFVECAVFMSELRSTLEVFSDASPVLREAIDGRAA